MKTIIIIALLAIFAGVAPAQWHFQQILDRIVLSYAPPLPPAETHPNIIGAWGPDKFWSPKVKWETPGFEKNYWSRKKTPSLIRGNELYRTFKRLPYFVKPGESLPQPVPIPNAKPGDQCQSVKYLGNQTK